VALIASGGVMCAEDAYSRLRAGASLVQVYTGLIYGGPAFVKHVNGELAALLTRDGFTTLSQAIGADLRRE